MVQLHKRPGFSSIIRLIESSRGTFRQYRQASTLIDEGKVGKRRALVA
jgi:hypothetical protein